MDAPGERGRKGWGRMYVLLLLIALLDFCLLLLPVLNPSSKRMKYKATSPPPLCLSAPFQFYPTGSLLISVKLKRKIFYRYT